MSEAPKVFCPKEGREVYVWVCIGSFMQQTKPCPYCEEATIYRGQKAKVKCKWKKTESSIQTRNVPHGKKRF
jgi:hypothetical protein